MEAWALAADANGIASISDLRRAGLTQSDVVALVKDDRLTHVARGWYALGHPDGPQSRHVSTTRAMLRAHEGRAVAAHHSALLMLSLPVYAADLSMVRLSRRTPGSPRTRPGQRLGRVVPVQAQLEETVVPALAVVQHGVSAGPLSALVAADGLLRRGVSADDLSVALEWVEYHPHTAALRSVLQRADGRHESPGETLLAHVLHTMNVRATPQAVITAGSFRAVADFLVDGADVVLEFDGKVKYGRTADSPDPFGRRRSANDVVWDEKRREDQIRELGYEVVRVTWADLDDPRQLADRIRRAIARARARAGRLTA